MAQCSECGARNADRATFCVRCGAQLLGAVTVEPPKDDTDKIPPAEPQPPSLEATLPLTVAAVGEQTEVLPVAPEAERLLREASERLAAGDADVAAARCREAISLAPDYVAAYSLLGMAEEQRGNTVAAAGAYRRVLQLDPARSVEREKLELLYASGAASRPEGAGEEAPETRVLRYAPWIAAAAAAFLVLMVLTGLGLRIHMARQVGRVYAQQMEQARLAMEAGRYAEAATAFEAALAARPNDAEARELLGWARRRAALAGRGTGAGEVALPVPSTSAIVASPGPNPFLPVPIGTGGQQPPVTPQPQTPRASTQPAPRPPVVDTQPVVGGGSPQTQAAGSPPAQPVPFGPLEPGDEEVQQPAQEPATAEPAQEPPARRGEITIWYSDAPTGGESRPAAPAPIRDAGAARAGELRTQADRARAGGDHGRAVQLYEQAIEAYRADSQANPGNRQANQAAIEACQRARSVIAAEEGQ